MKIYVYTKIDNKIIEKIEEVKSFDENNISGNIKIEGLNLDNLEFIVVDDDCEIEEIVQEHHKASCKKNKIKYSSKIVEQSQQELNKTDHEILKKFETFLQENLKKDDPFLEILKLRKQHRKNVLENRNGDNDLWRQPK